MRFDIMNSAFDVFMILYEPPAEFATLQIKVS